MQTIAEGVECQEQARRLREKGCDFGQGYLFSSPLAAADIVHLLETDPAGEARSAGLPPHSLDHAHRLELVAGE